MNAVEIEEAVSNLAEEPFDPAGFPFAFLEAFGNKKATIDKLRKWHCTLIASPCPHADELVQSQELIQAD